MKLGISAFAWTSKFDRHHLPLVEGAKEIGFSGFEIPMSDPSDLPVTEIRRAFEASAMECTVCAILPKRINPISPDSSKRKKSLQHLVRCIEASSEMGATLLGGPLYAPIGYLPEHRPSKDEWAWAVESFQILGEHLDASQMTLSIEPVNRSETFFLRTASEAKRLCEAIAHPRIGITMDTFHANIEERNITDSVALLGTHLKHLHASENDRGVLGRGHVDFPSIIAALRKLGYRGFLMIEGFGYSPHEKSAPGKLWADKSVSPDELASSGLRFLNQVLSRAEASWA